MDSNRLAEIASELINNYDAEVIACELGNEIAAMVADHRKHNVFTYQRTTESNEVIFSASHELHNEVTVTFPDGYFDDANGTTIVPETIRVSLDTFPTIAERLAAHGFKLEWTGGNCSAYTRYDKSENAEIVEVITEHDDPSIPETLDTLCDLGTGDAEDWTIGELEQWTLADILAALENPSDEYALLSLRLNNGFHKRTV